jgi:hypothetical protein
MNQDQRASAIKKMVIGCIIAEYGARQLLDISMYDLKQRVRTVLKSVKAVENWFMFNPNTEDRHRETFKKQFGGSEIMLIAELFDTVFGLDDDSIEEIINAIKKNLNEP